MQEFASGFFWQLSFAFHMTAATEGITANAILSKLPYQLYVQWARLVICLSKAAQQSL